MPQLQVASKMAAIRQSPIYFSTTPQQRSASSKVLFRSPLSSFIASSSVIYCNFQCQSGLMTWSQPMTRVFCELVSALGLNFLHSLMSSMRLSFACSVIKSSYIENKYQISIKQVFTKLCVRFLIIRQPEHHLIELEVMTISVKLLKLLYLDNSCYRQLIIIFQLQKYHMKQQLVYVRQYFQKDKYLNPVIKRVRPNVLKRSQQTQSFSNYTRHTPMDQISQIKRQKHSPSKTADHFKSPNFISPLRSEQDYNNKMYKEDNLSLNEFSQIAQSEKHELMVRNKELQTNLKEKEGKIAELGGKYDHLQMRLLALSSYTFESNLNKLGQAQKLKKSSRIPTELDRHSDIEQLMSIKERLNKINLSKFLRTSQKLQKPT